MRDADSEGALVSGLSNIISHSPYCQQGNLDLMEKEHVCRENIGRALEKFRIICYYAKEFGSCFKERYI